MSTDEVIRRQASELVVQAHEHAAGMRDVSLDVVNRVRPPAMRYSSHADVVREFLTAATAVASFAVRMNLISSEDMATIMRDFYYYNDS